MNSVENGGITKGWRARKMSFVDFEVANESAELVIEGDSPLLIHGPVADVWQNTQFILFVLESLNLDFEGERYSENGTLLEQFKSA